MNLEFLGEGPVDFKRKYAGKSCIISLVGGGGKTTLMYAFAEQLAGEGKKVLVSTTTRIFIPSRPYFAADAEEVRRLWSQNDFAVIGTVLPGTGKLGSPDPGLLEQLIPEADIVLIEADGSRHHPIKMPRQQEPVILPRTDVVITVMGLSALGRPLTECCFGPDQAVGLLNRDETHCLTEADAAIILSAPSGGRKNTEGCDYLVILNQWDNPAGKESAEAIAAQLNRRGVRNVCVSGFSAEEQRFYNKLAKEEDA